MFTIMQVASVSREGLSKLLNIDHDGNYFRALRDPTGRQGKKKVVITTPSRMRKYLKWFLFYDENEYLYFNKSIVMSNHVPPLYLSLFPLVPPLLPRYQYYEWYFHYLLYIKNHQSLFSKNTNHHTAVHQVSNSNTNIIFFAELITEIH